MSKAILISLLFVTVLGMPLARSRTAAAPALSQDMDESHEVYLPIVLRNHLPPTPTGTVTPTATPTSTSTPTATPTATPTLRPG